MPLSRLNYLSKVWTLSPFTCIQLTLQGSTLDNNLGPDRLPDPKALNPNHCRRPTLCLHDLCLEFITVHGTEFRLYGAKAFTILILLMWRVWNSSGIEPITFPTPSRCSTFYATDAWSWSFFIHTYHNHQIHFTYQISYWMSEQLYIFFCSGEGVQYHLQSIVPPDHH